VAKVDKYIIANPTTEALESLKAKVTIGASKVGFIELDVETGKNGEDLSELIDRACFVGTAKLKSLMSEYKGKVKSLPDLIQAGAHLLESMVRIVISVDSDEGAKKGV